MCILLQSVRRYKCDVDSLFGLSCFYKVASATTEFHFLIFCYGIFLSGKFHLAEIDYAIVSVD